MNKSSILLSAFTIIAIGMFLGSCSTGDPQPEIGFEVENNYFKAPVTVNFTNTSVSDEVVLESFAWDFDYGATSNEENPSHLFEDPGLYTVTLEATTDKGETYSTSRNVTVYDEIVGWEPRYFLLRKEAWASENLPLHGYIVVRNSSGNILSFHDNTFTINNLGDRDYKDIYIRDYELPLTSGSVTFELREADVEGDYVSPDNDRIIFSTKINTSDVKPSNSAGPYLPSYNDNANTYRMDIRWQEAD